MDTVSHGLWAYILAHWHPQRWFIVLGALFPDILIIGSAVIMFFKGEFNLMYPWFSQVYSWPFIPLIDTAFHSLIVWSTILGVSFLYRLIALRLFVYGVLFHIGIDVATHKSYIPKYLWPLSDHIISGIVEYRSVWFSVANIVIITAAFLINRRRVL